MDFYNKIVDLDKQTRKSYVSYMIEYLEDSSHDYDYIGFGVDNNKEKHNLNINGSQKYFDLDMRCFIPGYIRKNTKINYGFSYDHDGNASNDGNYYYIDTHDYIYEFCDFVSNYEVSNIYELFDYILEFLKNYFGVFKKRSRGDMFKMLVDNNCNNISPLNEHGLSWFKGMGNALCTEYSIMAQNILSVFGIETYLMIGMEKSDRDDGQQHAFNIVSFDGNDKRTNILVDFCNHVRVLNYDFSILGNSPFIGELEKFDQEFVDGFISNDYDLIFDDYDYYVLDSLMVKISYGNHRFYSSNKVINGDEVCYCKKK